MINEVLEIIRTWPVIAQVLMAMVMSASITILGIAVIGYIGDFINHSLPIILRGYPPYKKEDAED